MQRFLGIFALVATVTSDSNLKAVLKAGNDRFSANMLQEVVKSQGNKSCVLSAFSVLSPLAELALASVGESHDEILKTIGFPNDNVTKQVFTGLNAELRSVKGVDLEQANKLYIREGYSVNDSYAALTKKAFNSEIENIDFRLKIKAVAEINKWVEDHTHKRIKNLVDPNYINNDTISILVNAIYFKGNWKKPFKKYYTTNRAFHVTKNLSSPLPMMYQSGWFKYAESEKNDAKFLEMEYKGNETSLIVALPYKIDGINNLIEKFKDPSILNKAREDMSIHRVHVHLPRFRIETTTNLVKVLQMMNIKKVFQINQAKLYNLIKDDKDLYVSDAVQKAFIEVNEKGAEAAAANMFAIEANSLVQYSDEREFKADHPFLFFIMERNNILFSGVFRSQI